MRKGYLILLAVAVLLSACTGSAPATSSATASLTVTDGTTSKEFTAEQLSAMPTTEVSFNGVTYRGVVLTELLKQAGFDASSLKSVAAIADDGYTITYDAALFGAANTVVAFAQADGPLTADDGAFRMVLPDQEGKLNARMLSQLKVE